jgi:hypothetical protein
MDTFLLVTALIFLSFQSSLTEPPNKVLNAFKQKFPTAMNVKWIEEDNKSSGTAYIMGKVYKYVQDDENTWKANFIIANKKTSATFDLDGHWLIAQQEIKLEDIGVKEVSSAIKKDYHDCEIRSIKIVNISSGGTYYDVEGKCGNASRIRSYDYIGLPWPPVM